METPAPAPAPRTGNGHEGGARRILRPVAVVLVIVACAAVLLRISTPAGDGGPSVKVLPGAPSTASLEVLPSSLAGVDLTAQLTGDKAVAQIKDLHLTGFSLSWAEIAWYGDQAVAWAARGNAGGGDAEALASRMADSIAKAANTDFSAPEPVKGLPGVWTTSGFDQVHYFFASGDTVYWVSAADGIAKAALDELRQAAG